MDKYPKNNWKVELFLILGLTFLAGLVWYFNYNNYFTGIFLNDAMDYAGIARNLAEGDGFISQYLTPLSLIHQGIPQPDMWRAPLWPLVLSVFQLIFGFVDEASALGTGFFFILTAPLIFLLGRSLFSVTVGFVSTLIYLGSPQLLNYSISGMTEPMSIFLMVLMFLVLVSPLLKNSWGDVLLGLVIGLFYLTRYNALLFLPFLILYRVFQYPKPKDKIFSALRIILGFLVVTLPWFIRNIFLFGNPLFSLQKYELAMFTKTYPEYMMYGLPDKIETLSFLNNHFQEVIDKIVLGAKSFYGLIADVNFWGFLPVLIILFFLPVFWRDKRVASFKLVTIFMFLTQLGALLIIHFIPRLFYIFTPLLIIGAVGSVFIYLKIFIFKINSFKIKGLAQGLLLFFMIAGAGFCVYQNYSQYTFQEAEEIEFLPQIATVMNLTLTDDLILTNEGHILSWYGNRYALKFPYLIEMIPLLDEISPIDGLYISDRILWNLPEVENEWKNIYYNRPKELYNFYLDKVFKDKDGACTGLLYLRKES